MSASSLAFASWPIGRLLRRHYKVRGTFAFYARMCRSLRKTPSRRPVGRGKGRFSEIVYLPEEVVEDEESELVESFVPEVVPLSFAEPVVSPDLVDGLPVAADEEAESLEAESFEEESVDGREDDDEPVGADLEVESPAPLPEAGADGSLPLPVLGVTDVGTSFCDPPDSPPVPPLLQPAKSPITSSAAAIVLTHFAFLFICFILLSPIRRGTQKL
jgi:hypothetical protein